MELVSIHPDHLSLCSLTSLHMKQYKGQMIPALGEMHVAVAVTTQQITTCQQCSAVFS